MAKAGVKKTYGVVGATGHVGSAVVETLRVETVVVGREDAYTPVALAEQLRENVPGSRLVVIDNAGHMPNLERPDAFNEVMEEWLRNPD